MRRLARIASLLALAVALWMTVTAGMRLSPDPAALVWRPATPAEIRATALPLLEQTATPPALQARITHHLAQDPHDQATLQALAALAGQAAVAPPDAPSEPGPVAEPEFDPAQDLDALLAPQGNDAGTAQDPVLRGLRLARLAAASPVLFSPATSQDLAAGAGLALQARAAGQLSPPAAELVLNALRDGVDGASLASARSAEQVVQALRLPGFQPALDLCAEVGRLQRLAGTTAARVLFPRIATAEDARSFARAVEALGAEKVLVLLDMAGAEPLLHSTLRLSDPALRFIIGTLLLAIVLAFTISRGLASAFGRLTGRG